MEQFSICEVAAPTDGKFTWDHLLYRLFNRDGELLYVGRTNNLRTRLANHASDQPWWGEVARSTVEMLPSLNALVDAERRAIKTERPRYNVVHNRGDRAKPARSATPSKPRRQRLQPQHMPSARPVPVRRVDFLCASRGKMAVEVAAVVLGMQAYIDDDADDGIDATATIEQVAHDSNIPPAHAESLISTALRSGWLMEVPGGWRLTIPSSVYAMGAAACERGCLIHLNNSGEKGPVAPVAVASAR